MTSSSVFHEKSIITGPKISSLKIGFSGVTPVKIVGCTNVLFSGTFGPTSVAVAPLATASSICALTLSADFFEDTGASVVSGFNGFPMMS
ncbi:hypothetical protein D3C74_404970 [compost metagenome]